MRRDFSPDETTSRAFYKLLTAIVLPRPIAWVSSLAADGTANLAPHSFFTVAATDPPVVQFTSVGRKDSLDNVEATGEFVVNFCPEWLFEEVNATGTNFPAHESEWDRVGIESEPSLRVAPARVARSPAALECVLHATLGIGACTVVLGRVVHAAVDPEVLAEDGLPDVERLRPLARLGRNQWGTLAPPRAIDRIPYERWPGHFGKRC